MHREAAKRFERIGNIYMARQRNEMADHCDNRATALRDAAKRR
jgi:hypothetical protein